MGEINDEGEDAVDRDQGSPAGGGVASREDRYFLYRTISAMSLAGMSLQTVLERMSKALASSVDKDSPGPQRRRAFVDVIRTTMTVAREDGQDPFLHELFVAERFVLSAEERCVLSITVHESVPAALSAACAAAAEFVASGRAR